MTTDRRVIASQLVGKSIFNDKGEEVGTIAEVLVDPDGGTPSLLISVGHFLDIGEKTVIVSIDKVRLQSGRPTMDDAMTQRLTGMPNYQIERVNPQYSN